MLNTFSENNNDVKSNPQDINEDAKCIAHKEKQRIYLANNKDKINYQRKLQRAIDKVL